MTDSRRRFDVRPYRPTDEAGWLRCRALAFLDTQYYDDVRPTRYPYGQPQIQLVATTPSTHGDVVAGVLDIEIEGAEATIDTIAVDPDRRSGGIASALLEAALPLLHERGVGTLDAWTREDAAANAWYRRNGFSEQHRYLHVYLGDGDDASGFSTPDGMSAPVSAFMHASIEDEAAMRARYRRVYVCRQYLREV